MSSTQAPFLSIVITAHNCGLWLSRTFETIEKSLVRVPEKDCEVIIINDASQDESERLISDFCQRLPNADWRNTEFRNIGKVRNHAISLAKGFYTLMIDGDDLIIPEALPFLIQTLKKDRPDLYISKLIEERAGSKIFPYQQTLAQPLNSEQAITQFLIHKAFQAHVIGQFIRTDLLRKHPFPEFTCYEDSWVFPALLLESQTIAYNKIGFYRYQKHGIGLSSLLDVNKLESLIITTRRMDTLLPTKFSALIACHWLDIFNRHYQAITAGGYLDEVQQRIARENLISFLFNPKIRLSYKRKFIKWYYR